MSGFKPYNTPTRRILQVALTAGRATPASPSGQGNRHLSDDLVPEPPRNASTGASNTLVAAGPSNSRFRNARLKPRGQEALLRGRRENPSTHTVSSQGRQARTHVRNTARTRYGMDGRFLQELLISLLAATLQTCPPGLEPPTYTAGRSPPERAGYEGAAFIDGIGHPWKQRKLVPPPNSCSPPTKRLNTLGMIQWTNSAGPSETAVSHRLSIPLASHTVGQSQKSTFTLFVEAHARMSERGGSSIGG